MSEKAILIGDSQGSGLSVPLKTALASIGINVVGSQNHTGQQTIWFAREQITKQMVDRYRPDLVIIALGGNDAQRTLDTWLTGVKEVVNQAKARGARVVWIGTAFSTRPDVQTRHARVSSWQDASLPQLGVTWINSMPMTQGGHRDDGVHFTPSGYRAWANTIADELAILPGNSFPWIPLLLAGLAGYLFFRTVR